MLISYVIPFLVKRDIPKKRKKEAGEVIKMADFSQTSPAVWLLVAAGCMAGLLPEEEEESGQDGEGQEGLVEPHVVNRHLLLGAPVSGVHPPLQPWGGGYEINGVGLGQRETGVLDMRLESLVPNSCLSTTRDTCYIEI